VMVPKDHPLAAVNDSFNAVFARGNFVGDVMFYGRGAGELPTASAIVGDIIDLAMHQAKGGTSPRMNFGSLKKTVVPMGEVKTQFYLRLDVKDQPGVLASITKIFGDCGVSISAVTQKEATGESVELVIFTHEVAEADFQKAVTGIRGLAVVVGVRSLIRVHV
jgi:homoserine dehydrogenase